MTLGLVIRGNPDKLMDTVPSKQVSLNEDDTSSRVMLTIPMNGGINLTSGVVSICRRGHPVHLENKRMEIIVRPDVVSRNVSPAIEVISRSSAKRHLILRESSSL